MWRAAPTDAGQHVPACYEISGPVLRPHLERAVRALVARHESLRTTFLDSGPQVLQVVHRNLPPDVGFRTARSVDAALASAAGVALEPFDLGRGPLLRIRLWTIAPERHILLIAMHHIIVDERSTEIFENELAAYYTAAFSEQPWRPASLPVQYGDYAVWRQHLDLTSHVEYWRERLRNAQPCRLPPDRPWPASTGLRATTSSERVPGAGRALAAAASRLHCSPFSVFAAVFALFLSAETGTARPTFGVPVSVRPDSAANMIGNFMNFVAVNVDIAEGVTFADLVRRTHRTVIEAVEHRVAPMSDVFGALRLRPSPLRNPLFDAALFSAPTATLSSPTPSVLRLSPLEVPIPHARRYVAFVLVGAGGRDAALAVQHPDAVYGLETVARWRTRLRRLLDPATADPGVTLSDLTAWSHS